MKVKEKIKEFFNDESGASLIIEASIMFPFVIVGVITLIFFVNVLYMASSIQAIANEAASVGVRYATDPHYEAHLATGEIPNTAYEVMPYHHIFGDTKSNAESKAVQYVEEALGELDTGFFKGMEPSGVSVEANYSFFLLLNSFTVNVSYGMDLPIVTFFTNEGYSYQYQITGSASGADPKELIDTITVAQDLIYRTTFGQKINALHEKVSQFLGG